MLGETLRCYIGGNWKSLSNVNNGASASPWMIGDEFDIGELR